MKPSQKSAWIGVGGILIILMGGIFLKTDVILLLIISLVYLGTIAYWQGMSVQDFLDGMKEGCSQAFIGLLFFLLIGGLIGSWIQSGTVPALIYYGLNLLNPNYFLLSSFVICTLVSTIIGTSWGTVGTVGTAIIGIAIASGLSIPIPVIAGSIVSGAWFGDKMSPVSDSTVLTATACGTSVYRHIQSMAYTTIPAYVVSMIIFSLINWGYTQQSGLNPEAIAPLRQELESLYQMNVFVFIPPLVLVILSILKTDAVISLLSAIGTGSLVAIFVQKNTVGEALNAIMHGVMVDSPVEEINQLLNRGGIYSMMNTFLLGFIALCLGGALQKTRFLQVILEKIASKTRNVFQLVFITMISGTTGNAMFGDTYLSIVLNANLYRDLYQKNGLDASMLSRVIEESTTMMTPLIPWAAAGAFVAQALKVPTQEYAPYVVLNLMTPVISLLFTFFGKGIVRTQSEHKE